MSSPHLDAAVAGELTAILTSPARVAQVLNAANDRLASERPARQRDVDQIDREIADVQRRRANLMSLMEDTSDREQSRVVLARVMELDARSADLAARRDALVAEIEAAPPRRVTEEEVAEYLKGLAASGSASVDALLDLLAAHHGLEIIVESEYAARIRLSLKPAGTRERRRGDLRVVEASRVQGVIEYRIPTGVPMPVDEWVASEQGKHFCACGCGEAITILPQHHAPSKGGIPKYIQGHSPSPMELIQNELAREGYVTVQGAARILGIGENTVRRWAASGRVLSEERRYGDRPPITVFRKDRL